MSEEKKKILIIEDDKFLLKALQEQFKGENFDVIAAVDGEKGLDLILADKPDLVLLDLVLPKKNGLQILAEIKKNKDAKIKHIPIIILSNLGQEGEIQKGLELGAEEYLVKTDFSMEEITEKVNKILFKGN